MDFIQQPSASIYVDSVYRQYIELLIKVILITMTKTITIRIGEEEETAKVELLPHQKCRLASAMNNTKTFVILVCTLTRLNSAKNIF